MAYVGMCYPAIARYANGAYSDGFVCGKAVGMNATPNYSETTLYADDAAAETVAGFKDCDIEMEVTTLPMAAVTTVFGHAVSEGHIEYKVSDVTNDIGIGFVTTEKNNGVTQFVATIFTKCAMTEQADSYKTKGENIEFSTPTLKGKAMADENGKWKDQKVFVVDQTHDSDTQMAAAKAYINTYLGIA